MNKNETAYAKINLALHVRERRGRAIECVRVGEE
jgi:4-diphosphocytidyl-2C-methyl-D-erythritol kinase